MIVHLPIDPAEVLASLPLPLPDSFPTAMPALLAMLPDAVHWLPLGAALVLGLLLGGALLRFGSNDEVGEAQQAGVPGEMTGSLSISDIAAGQAHNASAGAAAPSAGREAAMDRRNLVADLAQATASAERQRAESEAAHARTAILTAHLNEQSLRVTALTQAVEKCLAQQLSPRQRSIAAARASLIELAESVRGGRQWLGAAGDQLDSLQRRIKAAEQRLWATAEETSGFRHHLDQSLGPKGNRKTSGGRRRLQHRVTNVDEQMRVFHQHLAGCLSRIGDIRSHIAPDHQHLRNAAADLSVAEARLVELDDIAGDAQAAAGSEFPQPFTDALAEAGERLAAARLCLGQLDARAIEDADEALERCHWVATEAPAGLRQAMARFGESESVNDISITMMLSRSWRKLSEVGTRLDKLRAVADNRRVGHYPRAAAPHALTRQAEKVAAALVAIRETETETASASAPWPSAEFTGPSTAATLPADAKTNAKLTAVRTALALRERELADLRQRCEELEAERQTASPQPAISNISQFVVVPRPGDFARQLVGLKAHSPEPVESISDVRFAAGNFRDARASLTELKTAVARPPLLEGKLKGTGNGHGSSPVSRLSPLPGPDTDHRSEDAAGNDLSALRAAFEKSLLRQDKTPANPSPAATPGRGRRDDIKRFEAASEDLLSAVAQKQQEQKNQPVTAPAPAPAPAPAGSGKAAAAGVDQAEVHGVELDGITAGQQIAAAAPETLLFRGDDPRRWQNSDLAQLPGDICYLRLRRLDTGESVVAPITRRELLAGAAAFSGESGWSGSGERYFGGVHLGLFDKSLPRHTEIRLGAGGWGFGHASHKGSGQACGWAGECIDDHTAFEITVGTQPVTGKVDADSPSAKESIANEEQLIFCGNDPTLWNQSLYQGARRRALALDAVEFDIGYLRLQRLDSGESVLLQTTRGELRGDDRDTIRPFGFHAGKRDFYAARHLGVFDERAANEVETRFTYGGWGFGHGNRADLAGRQCAGWAGQEIDADTVFQITVFRDRPAALEGEKFLAAATRSLAG